MRHGKHISGTKRNAKFTISDFTCTRCGMHLPIPRPKKLQRKKNHIKTMWCPKCKAKQQFLEKRSIDW